MKTKDSNKCHNKASWHKSCRDLYNNTKLERVKKRKLAEAAAEEIMDKTEEIPSSPVKARRSSIECYNPQKPMFFSVMNTTVPAIFLLHRPLMLTKKSESVPLF